MASEPQDISSKILARIDEATNATLNSALARSWLNELDEKIHDTKQRIHDRINSDLPLFEQQLVSSKSVQSRFQNLTSNVDALNETLSNPQTGLIPTLHASLNSHAALAQQAKDAAVLYDTLSHLHRCNVEFQRIQSLAHQGSLFDAVQLYKPLDALIEDSPAALRDTVVMQDLKRKFSATKARTEEQLGRACAECIIVTASSVVVHPSVQIQPTETILPLSEVVSSLSQSSLTNYLNTLRRDLVNHIFDPILKQPTILLVSEHQVDISLSTTDPTFEILSGRLDYLAQILNFLSENIFSLLPPEQSFPLSFCRPITTSMLNNLIIPTLPNNFSQLSAFLEFLHHAVSFEEQYMIGLLGNDSHDRPIKAWCDGVNGHYERKRRMDILDTARRLFVTPEDPSKTFVVHIEPPLQEPGVVQKEEKMTTDQNVVPEEKPESAMIEPEEDGWGFDDDTEIEEPPPPEPSPDEPPNASDADAWGLDDDVPPEPEEDAWDDDPWGESGSVPPDSGQKVSPTASPKVASRLAKLANKGKQHLNGTSPMNSPVAPSPLSPQEDPSLHSVTAKHSVPKESYVVSSRMKEILKMVEDVLTEGTEFSSSPPSSLGSSSPGTILLQSAPSVLDLYRALHPVVFNVQLTSKLDWPIRFSNNCLYLSSELEWLEGRSSVTEERLAECKHRFKVLSDSLLDDAVTNQRQSVDKLLVEGAEGFTFTSDQDRYDACEEAVNGVLQGIKRVAHSWKGLMPKSKYYTAIGSIVEAALMRILGDILALPDITAVESQRLSELCKILRALEGLFVEDNSQDPFLVAYAPSWLKYSYLSELLEATMADITYLFEEGLLVDFKTEELVRLVRALFADTALRTNLINKLTGGSNDTR